MATTTALVRTPTSKPTTSTTEPSPSISPSPGTWRHPRFTEIVQRQSAATFSDRDLRKALLNALALLLSFFFASELHTVINTTITRLSIPGPPRPTFWLLLTTRIYLLANTLSALRPLLSSILPTVQPRDQVTDIPLTPSQRALLGLDPSIPLSSASPSPFITPPRYRRSSSSSLSFSPGSSTADGLNTSTPDRRSISATYFSSSPLSGSSRNFSPSSALSPFRSPRGINSNNANGDSPFSPSASPLLQKAFAAKTNNSRDMFPEKDRRHSLGTSSGAVSGLGRSQSVRERGGKVGGERDGEAGLETPSPVGGGAGRVRRNPHLNYKWLYEKGATLPKSETMQF